MCRPHAQSLHLLAGSIFSFYCTSGNSLLQNQLRPSPLFQRSCSEFIIIFPLQRWPDVAAGGNRFTFPVSQAAGRQPVTGPLSLCPGRPSIGFSREAIVLLKISKRASVNLSQNVVRVRRMRDGGIFFGRMLIGKGSISTVCGPPGTCGLPTLCPPFVVADGSIFS